MQKEPTHIIHKLVVEVDTSTTKSGFELRDNAGKFVHEMVIPAVEKYITELELQLLDGETIELDKLVVNLESPTNDFSDPSWHYRLSDYMENSLRKVTQAINMERAEVKLQTPGSGEKFSTEVHENHSTSNGEPENTIGGLRFASKTERDLKAVFHFLRTGQRPWWIPSSLLMNQLLETEQLQSLLQKEKPLFARLFKQHVTTEKSVERWVKQLTDEQLGLMVSQLSPESSQEEVFYAADRLIFNKYFGSVRKAVREAVWKTLLASKVMIPVSDKQLLRWYTRQLIASDNRVLQKISETIKEDLIQLLELVHPSSGKSKTDRIKEVQLFVQSLNPTDEALPDRPADTASFEPNKVPLTDTKQEATDALKKENEPSPDLTESEAFTTPDNPETANPTDRSDVDESDVSEEELSLNKTREETTVQSTDKTKQVDLEIDKEEDWQPLIRQDESSEMLPESGLIVENAGLVLVHPFLKYFFQDIGLTDESDLLLDKELAVHVLHYVATGKTADYEHAMLFEKYLVGIPPNEPLSRDIELSSEILDKTKTLLNAIRTNWSPLSGTSDDGIRETFLVREGKLLLSDEFDRLIVEKKTVDILMEKLNWSVSMIHFPWMENVLYVEWS